MLEELLNQNKWNDFLEDRLNNKYLSKEEKALFSSFILEKKYENVCSEIADGTYEFSVPVRHLISKHHSGKKRAVYNFNNEEMIILKFIAFLLYDYDFLFTNNLYSFRKNIGVKNAVEALKHTRNLKNMFGYKLDISDYFNSINTDILLPDLKQSIDEGLYKVIEKILINPFVKFENKIIQEKKGIMAGNPLSAFLANFYIRNIDKYFSKEPVMYIRYADDIIIFSNSEEESFKYENKIKDLLLNTYHLKINTDKEYKIKPNENFEFLGFGFNRKDVDISENSINKMKKRIRRSCRGIRRWMINKNVSTEKAIKGIIRKYNARFFGTKNNELSWKYWFFPQITTVNGLKIIDSYFQEELRYIKTGKHNKRNLEKVPYVLLKKLGYKSLVHEYYLFINMKNNS